MNLKNIGLAGAGILILVVFFQNTHVTSIQFLFWKISMSRIILLPPVLAIGFIIGFFVRKTSKK